MAASDFLTPVIKGFTDILIPLEQSFSTPEDFEAFLVRYGWAADMSGADMTVINGFLTIEPLVQDVLDKLDIFINGTTTAQAQAAIDLIEELKNTIDQLSKLPPPGSGAPYPLDQPDFWSELTANLFSDLFATYLERNQPVLYALLYFTGVIAYVPVTPADASRVTFTRTTIDFSKLGELFSKPQNLLSDVYGWNSTTADFDHNKFLRTLERILLSFRLPAAVNTPRQALVAKFIDPTQIIPQNLHELEFPIIDGVAPGDNTYWKIGGVLLPIANPAPSSGKPTGILLTPLLQGDLSETINFTPDISLTFDGAFNADNTIFFLLYPGSASMQTDLSDTLINASVTLLGNPDSPWVLLGTPDSNSLQVGGFKVQLAAQGPISNPEITFSVGTGDTDSNKNPIISLIFQPGDGDSFITTIVGTNPIEIDFAGNFVWSSVKGLTFQGQLAFQIAIPLHLDIGPIEITMLYLALQAGNTGGGASVEADLGVAITANLGPLVAVVDNIGVTVSVVPTTPPNKGFLGNNDLQFGFKPPNGVGLSVDTGLITGGGYLYIDTAKGQYYGALELEFQDLFSLKAVGIINTIMPDGSSGFSLLIIITADFTPIQLGFGFTLNGVGGLLGLNRTMQVDVLREGIKTNAIQSVLFPQDVVANIDRIISDLTQIFPPYEGHFIVGPMGELGWADIITLEIGILIEIPDPKIAILGVIRALMPEEDAPLLRIQINFLGVIDFDNQLISFDASLYDSNLLIYTLTGDMAFRLSWGDNPYFLLSVGGFNPAFKDAPSDLQNMVRLGISLLNNDYVQISVTCYFAVTSNTVQFGAEAQLFAGDHGGFNIFGYLGFDALFQFHPFHFVIDIYAGFGLRSGTSLIMGITVSGQLSGPSPWNIQGSASISLLFFSISVNFNQTWGSDSPDSGPQPIDILAQLTAAVADNSNWRAVIPDNNSQHVSLRQIPLTGGELVIHPFGILTLSQRLVPLDISIDKFGNDVPKDVNRFTITAEDSGLQTTVAQEQFAPANFFNLSDSDKLSQPSFELMDSGFEITGSATLLTANTVSKDVDYRISYLRKTEFTLTYIGIYKYAKTSFQANLKAGAVSRSVLSFANNRISVNAPDTVTVQPEQYAIANMADMTLVSANLTAGSYTQAVDQYNNLISSRPELEGTVQIVNLYEINAN